MNMIALHHNCPVRVAGKMRIECVVGKVWLTLGGGGAGDLFLHAGESLVLGRHEAALVEALRRDGASIRLQPLPSRWRQVYAAGAGVLSSLHGRMRTLRFDRRRTPLAG